MPRKRKVKVVAVASAKKTDPEAAEASSGNAPVNDELHRWMSGETTLLAWLEEDPAKGPTFYTDAFDALEADGRWSEKLRGYEEEIARLKEELKRPGNGHSTELEAENARLKEELDRIAKGRDGPGRLSDGELSQRERSLREREAALAERERAGPKDEDLEKRYHAEIQEKEVESRQREGELNAKIAQLEEELKRRDIEDRLRQEELRMAKLSRSDASKEFEERMRGLQEKERRILELQEQINRLEDTVQERDDELKGLKEIVSYKEQELARREEDLVYRERKVTEEKRRLEEAKKTTGGLEEAELKKRLEELRAEVDKREKELKAKEEFLRAKEADLRRREQGAIEEELKNKDQELAVEVQQAKAKTGNPRLDDLLLGGVPFGSNVLVYGPPFVGKETMVNQFIAEGLKKGIPALWVTTDKTPADLREEMRLVLSSYEEYEALGLVRYVDSYSRSMGDTTEDKYTTYVDEPTDHDGIMDAVEATAKAFKEKHDYYRLAFRTISTLIAYSDPNTAFRFLNPFCGRRKRDRAVSMYTIEKGMHGDQEIQMLGSIMDGMIDFKIDQLRTFFMVRGITDVQSRSYIRYNATRHGLSIGSFALDHIK